MIIQKRKADKYYYEMERLYVTLYLVEAILQKPTMDDKLDLFPIEAIFQK